jgi:hypothetical protein
MREKVDMMKDKADKVVSFVKQKKWVVGYIAVLLLMLPLTVIIAGTQQNTNSQASAVPLAIDVQTGKNQSNASNKVTSPVFSTKAGNELVVVFLASDGSTSSPQSFTNVSGAGLNFTLVKRANGQRGTAEVWYAYTQKPLKNAQITATRQNGSYQGMIRVVTFTGAAQTPGATGNGSGMSGAPTVSLNTTVPNSIVLAVGNDPLAAVARKVGPNQRLTQQYLATRTKKTFWTQQQSAFLTTSGVSVTMNVTQPTTNPWNMTAIEVVPARQNVIHDQTTYSLWSDASIPSSPSDSDNKAVEVGVKFKSDVAGKVLGIRYYKSSQNTGTHVGNLWSNSGQLLGSATFSNETNTGWQQVMFANPVEIAANTVYVASYHTTVGHYAGDNNYFATKGVDNGPLHALQNGVSGGNGVYEYTTTSAFPTDSYQASNYWVDVLFQTAAGVVSPTQSQTNTPTPTGLSQISPTVPYVPSGDWPGPKNTGYKNAPGYPGSLKTCPTPIKSNTTYSFCDFPGGVDVGSRDNPVSNVKFFGTRFHGSGDVMVRLYGDNITFDYTSFEPSVSAPPVSYDAGYQYGIEADGGWYTFVQQLTVTHSDIWGFGNAIDINGSTKDKPQVFRDNWIHDARDDGNDRDHTDGIGTLAPSGGKGSYIVIDHNVIESVGNTNAIAFQGGDYDHVTITNNLFGGFNQNINLTDDSGGATNTTFTGNTFSTRLQNGYGPLRTSSFVNAAGSVWKNNKWLVPPGAWWGKPEHNGWYWMPNAATRHTTDDSAYVSQTDYAN